MFDAYVNRSAFTSPTKEKLYFKYRRIGDGLPFPRQCRPNSGAGEDRIQERRTAGRFACLDRKIMTFKAKISVAAAVFLFWLEIFGCFFVSSEKFSVGPDDGD